MEAVLCKDYKWHIFGGMSEQHNFGNLCNDEPSDGSKELSMRSISIYLTNNWCWLFVNFDHGFMVIL